MTVPGTVERSGQIRPKKGADVASEFESARLYLARWARVVAEEGEKARRNEVAQRAGADLTDIDDLSSSLGIFSLLPAPNSSRPLPTPTRTPNQPITSRDWESYAAQGRDDYYVRREIFRRGFSNSSEPDARQTRREGWEVLLRIIPWSCGGVGGGETGKEKRSQARQAIRDAKRAEYDMLKSKWQDHSEVRNTESWKEEWHRIDVSRIRGGADPRWIAEELTGRSLYLLCLQPSQKAQAEEMANLRMPRRKKVAWPD